MGLALALLPAAATAADLEIGDCKANWGMSPDEIRAGCPRWALEPPEGDGPERSGLGAPRVGGSATALELRPLDLRGTLRAAATAAGIPVEQLLSSLTPELEAALHQSENQGGSAAVRPYPSGAVERGSDRHRLFFVDGRLVEAEVQLASLPMHPGDRLDQAWSDPWSPLAAAARELRRRAMPAFRFDTIDAPAGRIERETWEREPGETVIVLDRSAGAGSEGASGPGVTIWERRRSPFAEVEWASATSALETFARPFSAWLERREPTRRDHELASELEHALAALGITGAASPRVETIACSGSGEWSETADLVAGTDFLLCILTFADGRGSATGAFAFDRSEENPGVGVLVDLTPSSYEEALRAAGMWKPANARDSRAGDPLAELAVDFWAGPGDSPSPRLPGGPLFGIAYRSRDAATNKEGIRWALLRPDTSRAGEILATGFRAAFADGKTSFSLEAVPDGFDLTLRRDHFDPTDVSTYHCHSVRWRDELAELSCDEAMQADLRWDLLSELPPAGLYRGRLGDVPIVGCLDGSELELYRERDGHTVLLYEDDRAHGRWNEVEPGEVRPEPLDGERVWLLDPPEPRCPEPGSPEPGSLEPGSGPAPLRGLRRGARVADTRFELARVAESCAPGFEARRLDLPRVRQELSVENGVEIERTVHPITGLPAFELVSGLGDEAMRRINGSIAERARALDEQYFHCGEWDGEVVPRFLSKLWVVVEQWGAGSCWNGEPETLHEVSLFDAESGEPIGFRSWLRPDCFTEVPRGAFRERLIEQFANDEDSTCLERAAAADWSANGPWLDGAGVHVEYGDAVEEFEQCAVERTISFDAIRPCITAAALPKFDRFVAEAKRISGENAGEKANDEPVP